MPITDLIPWKRKESGSEEEQERALQVRQEPFLSFQRQMDRMFDDFFRGRGLEPSAAFRRGWEAFSPSLDVAETDQEIKVSVELPGMAEEDIDVSLSGDMLTIRGEKRREEEERRENYYRAERSYGSFRRSVPLPSSVDPGRADAVFRQGVLTVTLPKEREAARRKRIDVKPQ